MTLSKNATGNPSVGSHPGFTGEQRVFALLLALSLLGTACDRATPPASPAPQAESAAATPSPDAVAPPSGAPTASEATLPGAVVVSDPRLRPWMEEYANTEAEEDRSGPIYRIAEQAALGVPAHEVVAALADVFSREKSATLKSEIIGHLTKIKDPSTLDGIARGLAPVQPLEVRLTAVRTFQFLADRRALPSLRGALSDPDPQVREAAQDAIQTLTENP